MTSARLSPAANLLRNSKLFALPAAIPLPPTRPAFEPVASSDTSTTTYPTRAAIVTTADSLSHGDWGLKRELPNKAFTKTKTPVIRIRDSIDTREHIADFDSAADHVQTLQKWESLPVMIGHTRKPTHGQYHSVFSPMVDNTTVNSWRLKTQRAPAAEYTPWNNATRQGIGSNGSSNQKTTLPTLDETMAEFKRDQMQKALAEGRETPFPAQQPATVRAQPKRWRYKGPWLAGMSNLDFQFFMDKLDKQSDAAFRKHLKKGIRAQRQKAHESACEAARADATDEPLPPSMEVTDVEADGRLHYLRYHPNEFGPEIAAFFDLPTGPKEQSSNKEQEYKYPSQATEASETYSNYGLPRTHPSAGFSYLRSNKFAVFDPLRGPMAPNQPVVARVLKDLNNPTNSAEKHAIGVGGIVARIENDNNKMGLAWQAIPGGKRVAIALSDASVLGDGSLEMGVRVCNHSEVRLDANNVPEMYDVIQDRQRAQTIMPSGYQQIPQMDSWRRGPPTAYKKASPLDRDDEELLEMLQKLKKSRAASP